MKQIKITRKELYNLVWEKPLNSMMLSYGVSYLELKALFLKHEIPVPANGYWSKLKAGSQLAKINLPKSDRENEVIEYTPKEVKTRVKRTDAIKQELIAKKAPFMLNKLASDALKFFQRESKGRPANRLVYIGYESLNIRVSPSIIERSIQFFNALMAMVENQVGLSR